MISTEKIVFLVVFIATLTPFASAAECIAIDDIDYSERLVAFFSGELPVPLLNVDTDAIDKTIYGWAALTGTYGINQNEKLAGRYLFNAFKHGSMLAGYMYTRNFKIMRVNELMTTRRLLKKFADCKGVELVKIELGIWDLHLAPSTKRKRIGSLVDNYIQSPEYQYYKEYLYQLVLEQAMAKDVSLKSLDREWIYDCAHKGYSRCAHLLTLLLPAEAESIDETSSYWRTMEQLFSEKTIDSGFELNQAVIRDFYDLYTDGKIENRKLVEAMKYCDVSNFNQLTCAKYAMVHHARCYIVDYGYISSSALNKLDHYRSCRTRQMNRI